MENQLAFTKPGAIHHVFQGRYKAIIVQKESYLLELARYIVLNPVRARMVRSAGEWPWSSYRATVALADAPPWLMTDWFLCAFSARRSTAVEQYQAFVADGRNQPGVWEQLKNQIYLGSDAFVQGMQSRQAAAADLSEIPLPQRRRPVKPLAHYAKQASVRDEAIALAYASGGDGLKEIGQHFGLHYSRVSRIVAMQDARKGR